MSCLAVVNMGIPLGYGVVGVLVSQNLVHISVAIEVKSVNLCSIARPKKKKKL
jgi:hypothetical protein